MDGFKIYLLGRTNLFRRWWDVREKSCHGYPTDLWLEHLGGWWSVYKDRKERRRAGLGIKISVDLEVLCLSFL